MIVFECDNCGEEFSPNVAHVLPGGDLLYTESVADFSTILLNHTYECGGEETAFRPKDDRDPDWVE
jgi:hypothetical protein